MSNKTLNEKLKDKRLEPEFKMDLGSFCLAKFTDTFMKPIKGSNKKMKEVLDMKDSYEIIRKEVKDIETQLMGMLTRYGVDGNVDPEGAAMLVRALNLIKASDDFMCKWIEVMESQNKKLDEILKKVGKG